MIAEEVLLHHRTAGPDGRAMLFLRAAKSWLYIRVPANIRARLAATARPRQVLTREDAATAAQVSTKPRQLRPIVVPASLSELHGPSSGLVTPPRRLWWSGEDGTAFDLSNQAQAAELYEAIFEAARTYWDIADHLNAGLLVELWPDLGMRRATRQAWEAAHPVLAAASASIHAA
ncbi:MAG: hypothetical protein JOY82_06890 [Streptosporangiaceae bacterium]|nr:hypothetical protein [Streptosporangiaceae bacterium]MBV9854239.1 hypothetical protein [Streptosporangiaceae bacterium]